MKKVLSLSFAVAITLSSLAGINSIQNNEVAERVPDPWSMKYELVERVPDPWSMKYELVERVPDPWSIKKELV